LGAIGDAGADVGFLDARIVVEDLGDRRTLGQQAEDQGDPDAVTAHAGLASADLGVDRDAVEEVGVRHAGVIARGRVRPSMFHRRTPRGTRQP
jgi:hypothetical protein